MVTLQNEFQITSTVLDRWWQSIRRDQRLFLRLMDETPEQLDGLPYLGIIITHIERNRIHLLQMEFPRIVKDARAHLLSSERYFVACLQALQKDNRREADMFYNLAQADLSMLQYIFMENGVKSYI